MGNSGTVEELPCPKAKFKKTRSTVHDDGILNQVLGGLSRAELTMEEAVEKSREVGSTKHFVTQAYIQGINSYEQQGALVEELVARCSTVSLESQGLLEAMAAVSRQLGTLRKAVPKADCQMAGYAAAVIATKTATAKQVYDAVTKGAGKKPAKKIAIMLAHALKDRLGEAAAASVINGKGGLKMSHVVGLEWLQAEAHSPEESDYCADSRSASDTD